METDTRTRRSVVKALIAASGAAALWRFLTPRDTGARPAVLSVRLADVPANGALALPDDQCAVVRSGDTLTAVDLRCTHLGCTVTATEAGFVCPCHGSRYGCGGQVEKGPATRSLARLEIEQRDDIVRVSLG